MLKFTTFPEPVKQNSLLMKLTIFSHKMLVNERINPGINLKFGNIVFQNSKLFRKTPIRSFFLLLLFVWATQLFSQNYVPKEADIQAFFKTKTLVVLESNPLLEYNTKITEAVKSNWNITEYEFVSYKEFEAKRKDPQYSFLLTTTVTFEKDKTKAQYIFLQLLAGGNYRNFSDMPDLVSIPLSYRNTDETNHIYKLGVIVRFVQNHMLLLKSNPSVASGNVLNYYNRNMGDIKTKTLYVVKDELASDVNTIEKIKKIYPHRIKIVTREEVEEAINQMNTDVVYLHKVGPEGTRLKARCYKIIMGASDAQFYYFDYHMIGDKYPDGIMKSDFNKMAK